MTPEPIIWGPLTVEDFVRYAGASGDFNPLHYDRDHARAAGMPDALAQGMLLMGLLGSSLERWYGRGHVRALSVRFRAPALLGDTLTAHADAQPDGALSVWLARGETVVISGTAEVRQ